MSASDSYTSWHVGMKVVCVDSSRVLFAEPPEEGKVYSVSEIKAGDFFDVLTGRNVNAAIGVKVQGIHLDTNQWFNGRRFRPVQERKTDISIFTAMLHHHKEHVQ